MDFAPIDNKAIAIDGGKVLAEFCDLESVDM
jgi:hypothetical protein